MSNVRDAISSARIPHRSHRIGARDWMLGNLFNGPAPTVTDIYSPRRDLQKYQQLLITGLAQFSQTKSLSNCLLLSC
jgi:hypothetical protein